VLDCGRNVGRDQARWSPGVNEGKPIEFSDNCYLIRHTKGLLLWDTGVPDAVAAMPDGMVVANGAITYRRAKTLAVQLTELGVKPEHITYVAVSHTHGDHVGNVALFPSSTVLIQASEYEWAMAGENKPAFAASQKFAKLAGDHDVFGDGTVTILSTPGSHAGSPVVARSVAEDRRRRAVGGRRALPGQLGAQARAVDERQPRADARVAAATAEHLGRAQGAVVDQPRQAAERRLPLRARVLRMRRAGTTSGARARGLRRSANEARSAAIPR
jgi:hypothetical protein